MIYSKEVTRQILAAIEKYRLETSYLTNELDMQINTCVNQAMHGETANAIQNYYFKCVNPKLFGQSGYCLMMMDEIENLIYSIENCFITADSEIGRTIEKSENGKIAPFKLEL